MSSPGFSNARFLCQPGKISFGTQNVTESMHVLILNYLAHDLRTEFAEPGERIVDVLHGQHDSQGIKSVHRSVAVISNQPRCQESREFGPALTVLEIAA